MNYYHACHAGGLSTAGAKHKLFGLSSRKLCAIRTSLGFLAMVGFWFFCAVDKRTRINKIQLIYILFVYQAEIM